MARVAEWHGRKPAGADRAVEIARGTDGVDPGEERYRRPGRTSNGSTSFKRRRAGIVSLLREPRLADRRP